MWASCINLFGIVFQDFAKYAVTLRENITFGDASRPMDEARPLLPLPDGEVNGVVLKEAHQRRVVAARQAGNELIRAVGLNGAGKTTLIKLMTRLYDPTAGEILLDGVNIKAYGRSPAAPRPWGAMRRRR